MTTNGAGQVTALGVPLNPLAAPLFIAPRLLAWKSTEHLLSLTNTRTNRHCQDAETISVAGTCAQSRDTNG